MRVLVYERGGRLRVEERPVPAIGPGELLVRIRYCGVCGSDVMDWYMDQKAPTVPGHEPAGEVVEVGDGVRGFSPGDRVFVHHHAACGVCRNCRRGYPAQCEMFRRTRLDPGGMAEYVRVPTETVQRDVLKLPEGMPLLWGTLVEPVACVVQSLRRARIRPGDTVLILGAGFNGLVHLALARAFGAGRVLVSEPIPWRRRLALELGADGAVDPGAGPVDAAVRELNDGRLADVVFVIPGKPGLLEEGIRLAGSGGTVVLFAPTRPGVRTSVEPFDLFFREVSLVPTYSCGPHDTRLALEWIARGTVPAERLITHRVPLEEAAEAFRVTADPSVGIKAVVELA